MTVRGKVQSDFFPPLILHLGYWDAASFGSAETTHFRGNRFRALDPT